MPAQYPGTPYPPQAQHPGQPYPPQMQYPGQPPYAPQYAPYGYPAPVVSAPQIVIHNSTTAMASAGAYGLRKRNSFALHVVLFFLTVGIGNILYAWYVFDWNRKRGL
jgi:hypothetical protein